MENKIAIENEKRKLSELSDSEIDRYAGKYDMQAMHHQNVRSENNKLWMTLISSGWFSCFLQYLNLKDIAILDSAFCNREDRISWLILLRQHTVPFLFIERNILINEFANWLILKNTFSSELKFSLMPENNTYPDLSDENMIKLINNCPHLKSLEVNGEHEPIRNFSAVFSNTIDCYSKLEVLKLEHVDITENTYELLSKSCHQLKVIEFYFVSITGTETLLMASKNLLELYLNTNDYDINVGSILEVLGSYCPSLQSLSLLNDDIVIDETDKQIEIFTKGCPYLKSLYFHFGETDMFDKLFLYLGTYNPLFEELTLINHYNNPVICTLEPIKVFSMGCPLVRKIVWNNMQLSTTECFNHLINNCTQLEELTLEKCRVCKDGLIITKESDKKLQNLKNLNLSGNDNLTDESFINIIKGCYNLKTIRIHYRHKLTDASLMSIAANCPNLEALYFHKAGNKFRDIGINELKTKCLQLKISCSSLIY